MNGFVVLLTPKDSSGITRNKEYMEKTKGLLAHGGVAELFEDGTLLCSWIFPRSIPDYLRKNFVSHFTKELDEAIRKRDNITYEVRMI